MQNQHNPASFRRLFPAALVSILLQCPVGGGVSAVAAAEKTPNYKLASKQTVDYGGRIDYPYILDVYDVNADGADDFAVSGRTLLIDDRDVDRNKPIKSSLVVSSASDGKFVIHDLGEGGLTRRTWDGRFFRAGPGDEVYLVLGGDGELGLPHQHRGEHQSFFAITHGDTGVSVKKVYQVEEPGTASSVDSCDIDGDGHVDIYINNNGGLRSEGFLKPHMITLRDGVFEETSAPGWLSATDKDGSYNDVSFADVNGDGKCDFLAAIVAEKAGDSDSEYTNVNTNDRLNSYVVMNKNGTFSGEPLDLPNPYFGKNTGAFSISTVVLNGETLVALTTSEFKGHKAGFAKFVFQLFALRDGAFVEVTKDLVSGAIDNDLANQAPIRVQDLDGDGDDDIYFGRYSGGIQVYLNDGRKFVRKKINISVPKGQKAVAFLRHPKSACADIAVLHVSARLYRFHCILR